MKAPILALEVATAYRDHAASLALKTAEHVAFQPLEGSHSQASQLVPAIEALLAAHQLTHTDLAQLAITVGPGSFTGIRIGLAVARAMAFACPKLQLIPVTTLEAMVSKADPALKTLQVVLRAGKGDVYYQRFSYQHQWQADSEIQLGKAEDLLDSSLPIIGNGHGELNEQINARDVLKALDCVASSQTDAVPLYIRPPDAKIPRQIFAT